MDGGQLGGDRPLYFLHIPKTGGVSLTDAIGRLYPPDRMFGYVGNVSVDFLKSIDDRLTGRTFIAGHPGPGAASYLAGRADIITMLRRPEDQAVSSYLHVLADPTSGMHALASSRSFADYLRQSHHQITFQTVSLGIALAIATDPTDPIGLGLGDAVPAFLESLPFVGVIEQYDRCCDVLSHLIGPDRPLEIAYLNTAIERGISAVTIQDLKRQYHGLKQDPELSGLFALEALVYARAEAVLSRLHRELSPARSLPRRALDAGFIGAWRFHDHQGPLQDAEYKCPLAGDAPQAVGDRPTHLIYGPFDRLKVGHYAAEFHLGVEGVLRGGGWIEIDVLINRTTRLRRRRLSVRSPHSHDRLTLAFHNPDDANILEFRVRAIGCRSGRLVFKGVTVRPSNANATWPSVVRRRLGRLRPGVAPPAGVTSRPAG